MKKISLLFTALLMSLSLLAQAPQGINYQTVIRDGDGDILPDTELSLQMTIRSGTPDGEVVYQENHDVTTNTIGLVNLVIGRGTPLSGSFGAVAWGKNSHYLETAIDITGSKEFQVMGVTQFLSVPYAQFSGYTGSVLTMTTHERNALPDPPVGMQIYNITTNCLNYYNGAEWFETCGNQVENFPPDVPVYSMPPDGAMDMPLEVLFQWSCSDPEGDPLLYDFYLGTNNPPPLDFTTDGTAWGSYPLTHSSIYFWKVVARDDHDNATEGPLWSFQTINCAAPEVYVGDEAIICEGESFQIAGATIGTSATLIGWTTSGDGTFSDPLALNPVYTPGTSDIEIGHVILILTASTTQPCPPIQASGQLHLFIERSPVIAAGEDATVCSWELVPLNAFGFHFSSVEWFILTGFGEIENPNQLNATYIPSNLDFLIGWVSFVIYAAPISPCTTSAEDWINITFVDLPEADAGPDQLNLPGTTATLAGNTPPAGGSGVWSINSGAGGNIAQPNNPTSTFTGVAGVTYVLIWEVESEYGCYANDDVTISFA
ncbi:MAG: hypothetical protein IH598_02770, partial [Bacteroidales bacterium]|nr:hypothetical protein [Bacteroidales bacterium]